MLVPSCSAQKQGERKTHTSKIRSYLASLLHSGEKRTYLGCSIGMHACILMVSLCIVGKKEVNDVRGIWQGREHGFSGRRALVELEQSMCLRLEDLRCSERDFVKGERGQL